MRYAAYASHPTSPSLNLVHSSNSSSQSQLGDSAHVRASSNSDTYSETHCPSRLSSTPKAPKTKTNNKRISAPSTDGHNDTPKPKPGVAFETSSSGLPTASESEGSPLWQVLFTVATGLIAILAVCRFTLTPHSRWLRIGPTCPTASAQVPGPAQDNAYKLALSWGIIGHSGPSGVTTPKVRTKVKVPADEERSHVIVHAFEVGLLVSFFRYEDV